MTDKFVDGYMELQAVVRSFEGKDMHVLQTYSCDIPVEIWRQIDGSQREEIAALLEPFYRQLLFTASVMLESESKD